MNCQEVMELMQRHVDGDLDRRETALMTAHVGGCPDCAVMLERLQRLSDGLSQLPRVVPKFSIVDAIMPQLDRLEAERAGQEVDEDTQVVVPQVRSERPRGRLLRRLSGIVAVGVVAGILLVSQQYQLSNKNGDNDAAAPGDVGSTAFSLKAAEGRSSTRDGKDPAAVPQARAEEPNAAERSAVEPNGAEPSAGADKAAPSSMAKSGGSQEESTESEEEVENRSDTPIAEPGLESIDVVDQYGADDFVTTTSGSETDKAKAAETSSPANSLTTPATPLVSPDGQWRAVAIEGDGTLRIFATKDDSLVFQSEQRMGSLSRLAWDPDSKQLTYTWTDELGKGTNFAYDAKKQQEITR